MQEKFKKNYFSCQLIISRSRRLVIMSHFWHSNSLYFEIVCNSCSWNNKIAPTALRKRDKSGCKIQLLRSALVCIFFFNWTLQYTPNNHIHITLVIPGKLCKGQLISKCLIGYFNSPKKRAKTI